MELNVFLDMDGVLANFSKGSGDLLGMPIEGNLEDMLKDKEYNKKLMDKLRSFPEFFYKLEPLPGALALYHKVLPHKPVIVTALPYGWKKSDPESIRVTKAKTDWLSLYLGFEGLVHCVESGTKHFYRNTNPGVVSLLIDDFKSNTEPWEKSGGYAILHKDVESTIKQIETLERYVKEFETKLSMI